MKKNKKCGLLGLLLCLVAAGVCGYLFKDKIRDKFFNSKYEDTYLKLLDVGRLVWDLVNWPVDWVRAMLP